MLLVGAQYVGGLGLYVCDTVLLGRWAGGVEYGFLVVSVVFVERGCSS